MSVNTKCIVLSFDSNNMLDFLEVKKNPLDRIYYNTFFDALTSNEFDHLSIEELQITQSELEKLKFKKVWIEDILDIDPNDEDNSIYNFLKLPDIISNKQKAGSLFTIYKKILNVKYKVFIELLKTEKAKTEDFNSYHSITVISLQLLLFIEELLGILQVYEKENKDVVLLFCEY